MCLVAGKVEQKQDSRYSTPNAAVDEFWVCIVLEYVPVTSVKLAVHFCDQSAMLQLHEKHKVIIQKAVRKWQLSHLFCNRGLGWGFFDGVLELFFSERWSAKPNVTCIFGSGWPFLLSGGKETSIQCSCLWPDMSQYNKQGLFQNIIISYYYVSNLLVSVWHTLLIGHGVVCGWKSFSTFLATNFRILVTI